MNMERQKVIDRHRQLQPVEELERKAEKAARWGFWTQEDLDLAKAKGAAMAAYFDGKWD